jgi:predicted amidophosphoribosyltransferase
VYVTWNEEELNDAINARVGTVLIRESLDVSNGTWPDLPLNDISELGEYLKQHNSGTEFGYFGEVASTMLAKRQRAGDSGIAPTIPVSGGLPDELQLYTLGRYFASRDDRARKHQYTQRILRSKDGLERVLAEVLSAVLKSWEGELLFDTVLAVPPKPSKPKPSGLQQTVYEACKIAGNVGWYDDKMLVCLADYPSQKDMPWKKRPDNVKGKYAARASMKGRSIVLVDDIWTSGSTLLECSKQLLKAGAESVTGIVFGVDQGIIPVAPEKRFTCNSPGCNGERVIRFSRKDGIYCFWGCSQFYGPNKCGQMDEWLEGLRQFNRLNRTEDILLYKDISF